jgi:hypothetical protein
MISGPSFSLNKTASSDDALREGNRGGSIPGTYPTLNILRIVNIKKANRQISEKIFF